MMDCIKECRIMHQQMKEKLTKSKIHISPERTSIPIIFDSHSSEIIVTMHGFPDPNNTKKDIFHKHNYFELVYVYHGSCINEFNNSKLKLDQGDILLLNPFIVHRLYTLKEDDYIFNIQIPTVVFEHKISLLLIDNPIFHHFFMENLYQNIGIDRFLYFTNNHNLEIHQSIQIVIKEYFTKLSGYHSMIEAQLIYLFGLLSRQNQISFPKNKNVAGYLILDIISRINQHHQNVSLAELADETGYSKEHLTRTLKKYTGKSFSTLLQECRMNMAAVYLQTTNMPIQIIAEKIGLHDISYFYRIFKEFYGMTPTQYRNQ